MWKKSFVEGQIDLAHPVKIRLEQTILKDLILKSFLLHYRYRVHTGERHKCAVCDKTYATWKSLKQHLGQHKNDEIPNRCNVCGNIFTNEKQLEKHRRHTEHHVSVVSDRHLPLSKDCQLSQVKEQADD